MRTRPPTRWWSRRCRSLEGYRIEDYANRLFRHWQLGQKDKDNGALLLVAPKERKVRIEVGYGLEGALTDALSKVIITTAIAPQFQKGNFAGGIDAGVDAMLSILTGDAEEWQRRAEVREDEHHRHRPGCRLHHPADPVHPDLAPDGRGPGPQRQRARPPRARGSSRRAAAGAAAAEGGPAERRLLGRRRLVRRRRRFGELVDDLNRGTGAPRASAIGDVEDDTSGEIVLVIAEQAGDYRAIPLLWALLAALVDAVAADLAHGAQRLAHLPDPARGGARA